MQQRPRCRWLANGACANHRTSILAVNRDAPSGQYFIVMEFVEGDNLRNILSIRGKLEADEALRMMEECAQGLVYAYSRGLTHRDIKPTNILIGTDKITKLVDFGLAEMSAAQDAAGIQVGRSSDKDEDIAIDRTLDYAGLEKATQATKGDVRSDIYFLGHVLFEVPAEGHRHVVQLRGAGHLHAARRELLVEVEDHDGIARFFHGTDVGPDDSVDSDVEHLFGDPLAHLAAVRGNAHEWGHRRHDTG